jgi:hypothetical protein
MRVTHPGFSLEAANIHIDEGKRLADGSATGDLAAPVRTALAHFAKARDYARDVRCDPWEFALEIDRLISMGVTTSDLRWLVKKGYIEHACEVTRPSDATRRFERRQNLAFTAGSCFLLADTAPSSTEEMGMLASPNANSPRAANPDSKPAPFPPSVVPQAVAVPKSAHLPRWDTDDRTLYVGDLIVKEYRVRSPNQEAVLSAFQEEQWPHYIDDPLSPVPDQSPKQRLRDTVKRLNENQKNHLIRFRGDGTGERVRWELIQAH